MPLLREEYFSIKNLIHWILCSLAVLPCFDVAAIAGPLGLLDSAPRPDIHCLLATSAAPRSVETMGSTPLLAITTEYIHCAQWRISVCTVEKSIVHCGEKLLCTVEESIVHSGEKSKIDTTAGHYWISIVLKWNTPADRSIPEWYSWAVMIFLLVQIHLNKIE